jgi:1-acyl-sn-glycerol-3-phosphate acyltransferase
MKSLRSIVLWTIGLIYFGLFCIIAIILSYLLPLRKFDGFVQLVLRGLFKVMFIKVDVIGADKLDKNKTYLLMANHVSLFDVPLLKGFVPVYCIGVEAHHQFKWPLYGMMVKRLGTIPIERENVFASIRSIKKAQKTLKSGTSIVILPEGHRTLTGEMRPFKKLPFHLAKKAEVEIVPIGLSGLFDLKKKGSWHVTPGKVTINFGHPIKVSEIKDLEIEDLRDRLFAAIKKLIIHS